MSGLYSACRVAGKKEPGLKISIVNSRGLSAQTGLIALRAAEAIEAGMSHEDVAGLCEEWVAKSGIFVDVTSIRHMVRSGRLARHRRPCRAGARGGRADPRMTTGSYPLASF